MWFWKEIIFLKVHFAVNSGIVIKNPKSEAYQVWHYVCSPGLSSFS